MIKFLDVQIQRRGLINFCLPNLRRTIETKNILQFGVHLKLFVLYRQPRAFDAQLPVCRKNYVYHTASFSWHWNLLYILLKIPRTKRIFFFFSAVKIKKNRDNVKFKVRCSRFLYTLVIQDREKAEKLKQSLPPGEKQRHHPQQYRTFVQRGLSVFKPVRQSLGVNWGGHFGFPGGDADKDADKQIPNTLPIGFLIGFHICWVTLRKRGQTKMLKLIPFTFWPSEICRVYPSPPFHE